MTAGKGGGVIQGTASEAVLVVLLAARDKILRRLGRSALPKLVMYASDQTHSALRKACQVPPMTDNKENDLILCTQGHMDFLLVHFHCQVNFCWSVLLAFWPILNTEHFFKTFLLLFLGMSRCIEIHINYRYDQCNHYKAWVSLFI